MQPPEQLRVGLAQVDDQAVAEAPLLALGQRPGAGQRGARVDQALGVDPPAARVADVGRMVEEGDAVPGAGLDVLAGPARPADTGSRRPAPTGAPDRP